MARAAPPHPRRRPRSAHRILNPPVRLLPSGRAACPLQEGLLERLKKAKPWQRGRVGMVRACPPRAMPPVPRSVWRTALQVAVEDGAKPLLSADFEGAGSADSGGGGGGDYERNYGGSDGYQRNYGE